MSESNGYKSPFIDDGMEGEFTIPEIAGMWSQVRGRYRPYCAAEESAVYAKSQVFPGIGTAKFFSELFATKILDWDVKNSKGDKVPVTAENIGRLHPDCFEILKEKLKQSPELPKN